MATLLLTTATASLAAAGTTTQSAPPVVDDYPSAAPATAAAVRPVDVRFDFGVGGFGSRTIESGVTVSVLGTVRYRYLQAGLIAEGGAQLFAGEYGFTGGVVGPVWQSASGARLELLGVAGSNTYHLSCGLFCESRGASASLPWAGVRAGASYRFFPSRRGHFDLGLAGTFGSDLRRRELRYSVEEGLWISTTSERVTTVGGTRASMLLTLGGSFDLG